MDINKIANKIAGSNLKEEVKDFFSNINEELKDDTGEIVKQLMKTENIIKSWEERGEAKETDLEAAEVRESILSLSDLFVDSFLR